MVSEKLLATQLGLKAAVERIRGWEKSIRDRVGIPDTRIRASINGKGLAYLGNLYQISVWDNPASPGRIDLERVATATNVLVFGKGRVLQPNELKFHYSPGDFNQLTGIEARWEYGPIKIKEKATLDCDSIALFEKTCAPSELLPTLPLRDRITSEFIKATFHYGADQFMGWDASLGYIYHNWWRPLQYRDGMVLDPQVMIDQYRMEFGEMPSGRYQNWLSSFPNELDPIQILKRFLRLDSTNGPFMDGPAIELISLNRYNRPQ